MIWHTACWHGCRLKILYLCSGGAVQIAWRHDPQPIGVVAKYQNGRYRWRPGSGLRWLPLWAGGGAGELHLQHEVKELFVFEKVISLAPGRHRGNLNPLRAKFFGGNKNIYLHFMSFLHIDMTQVFEIFPHIGQEDTYSTKSISGVLMSWRHKEPGYQQPGQPWYWPS